MSDRVVFAHVIGIVGPEQDLLHPEQFDQGLQLIRRENDGIEIDLLQVETRRLRQRPVRVAARAPGMIDPPGIGRQIAAAMRGDDLQVGYRSSTPSKIR